MTTSPTATPSPKTSAEEPRADFVMGRLVPAMFVLHGSALLGGVLGGVLGSSAASKVFWTSFLVIPGAVAGVVGYALPPLGKNMDWIPAAILGGALTLALLWLVDRARTWEPSKGVPVIILAALFSGAQALWLVFMMRA